MKTKQNHTPGPWVAVHHLERHGAKWDGCFIMRPHPNDPPENPGGDGMVIAEIRKGWGPSTANTNLITAAPEMLEALRYAAEIIKTARQYFPKSIKNSDKFRLENVNAAIGKAIYKAEG